MAKEMLLTEEGYKALVDELDYLKNVRRQEVKDSLKVARSFGDLSENSEYDEAKNEQAKVEARIAELEQMIGNAKVVRASELSADVIHVGSTVKVFLVEDDEEMTYSIVGSNEADPLEGKISDLSPIGNAILGAKVGDEVAALTPGGELHLRILEVTRTK